MPLCSCLSQKSTIDAVHQDPRPTGGKPSVVTKQLKGNTSVATEDMSLLSPKGTIATSATENSSPVSSSLGSKVNSSLDVILHAADDKFLEFVEQITSLNNDDNNQEINIPSQIDLPSLDSISPVSAVEGIASKTSSIIATTERLEHIHRKVLHLQFENDAMKAINRRLFESIKKLKVQSAVVSNSIEQNNNASSSSSKSLEESNIVQELSNKLSKQEDLLDKQRAKYEKLKLKLNEKKNVCKSLLKGHILSEDNESIPRTITANPDAVYVERLHFEKELDVLELEVRCLQKELAAALDQGDRLRDEQIRDKKVIETLRMELNEKNALIESWTRQNSHETRKVDIESSPSSELVPQDTASSQTSAAQDMLQELSSLLQIKQEEKEPTDVNDDLPSMSKFLQLRKLQKELSSAQRQIRDQQRELKALASSNGISEFMKIWRSEKESLEKRILELEHELQRSIRSKHDASFYSAEESSISSIITSQSICSHSSEKSPRPVSPSYFLNAQVGWLQGLEISRGRQ